MNITKRTIEEAKHIIRTKDTIRKTASIFNVCKSTVHKDISKRLRYIDLDLYLLTEEVLKEHIELRSIRGGAKTKLKYEKLRQQGR